MNYSKFFLLAFSFVWGILGSLILFQNKDLGIALKISTITLGLLTWVSLLFVTYKVNYNVDLNVEDK